MAYEQRFGRFTFNLDQLDADARAQVEQAMLLLEECHGKGYDRAVLESMLADHAVKRLATMPTVGPQSPSGRTSAPVPGETPQAKAAAATQPIPEDD